MVSLLKYFSMNVGSVNRNWKSGIRPPEPFKNVAEETRELLGEQRILRYKSADKWFDKQI